MSMSPSQHTTPLNDDFFCISSTKSEAEEPCEMDFDALDEYLKQFDPKDFDEYLKSLEPSQNEKVDHCTTEKVVDETLSNANDELSKDSVLPRNEVSSPVSVDHCTTEKVVDIVLDVTPSKLNNIRLPSNKKSGRWSKEEQRLFLIGLKKYGKGRWKNISEHVVLTRTTQQVASHAQKYFLLKNASKEKKKRKSTNDINDAFHDSSEFSKDIQSPKKDFDDLPYEFLKDLEPPQNELSPSVSLDHYLLNKVPDDDQLLDFEFSNTLVHDDPAVINFEHDDAIFHNFNHWQLVLETKVTHSHIHQTNRVLRPNFAMQPPPQIKPFSSNMSHQMSTFGNFDIDPNYIRQQHRILTSNLAMQPPPQVQPLSYNVSHQITSFGYSNIGPNYTEQHNWIPHPNDAMQAKDISQFNISKHTTYPMGRYGNVNSIF